jgi:hypothetical protein
MLWDARRVDEAQRRVARMLRDDPLRLHNDLTDEQLDLDARMMAAQIVSNVLSALADKKSVYDG